MDEDNISDLKERAPEGSTAKILLLGDFDPEWERIIRDPYYVSRTFSFQKSNKKKNQLFSKGHWL